MNVEDEIYRVHSKIRSRLWINITHKQKNKIVHKYHRQTKKKIVHKQILLQIMYSLRPMLLLLRGNDTISNACKEIINLQV